jgi:hypothetical protein
MYRIPHGKYRNTQKGNKPLVLLQHGVTLSSNSFVLLNANESMAYILADAGEPLTGMTSRHAAAAAAVAKVACLPIRPFAKAQSHCEQC